MENLDPGYIGTGQLALARGGTGADLSGTGGSELYLKQTITGAVVSVATIPASDLPVFVAPAASHAPGAVPDPGSTAGTTSKTPPSRTRAGPWLTSARRTGDLQRAPDTHERHSGHDQRRNRGHDVC